MSEQSPWAPRSEDADSPEAAGPDSAQTSGGETSGGEASGGDSATAPAGQNPAAQSPAGDDPAGDSSPLDSPGPDAATALGAAVVLLALAGICALLGAHFVLGALRLAAGILAGAGLGAALLSLPGSRPRPRARRVLAAVLAVLVALALTVPAVLATRVAPLADRAAASIDALAEGDLVHSVPVPGSPVLVRRAGGTAQLLDEVGARPVEATGHDVLALSADGARLVRATGATTEVLSLDRSLSAPDGGFPTVSFEGTPLALDGDRIVLRHCSEGLCRLSGYDLTAPDEPLWVVSGSAETRGTDPAGTLVDARPAEPPGLLDAARATGVLPAIPLHFDPAQGWVQLDPTTGFPVGRILAGPEEECRIAAAGEASTAQDPLHTTPRVLTVCSGEDGALTATAFHDGEQLWESAPSPAGTWSVRLDQGRVLATGTEEGAEAPGEIVATERQADWTAPGGQGVRQVAAFSARIGIDGARMVVTNESGQLLAYDTADGTNTWTLALSSPDAAVRGSLDAGTAVVLDAVVREEPLEPRGTQRLRVIDATTGEVGVETLVAEDVGDVHAVGAGRALVTVAEESLLLVP